MSTMVFVILNLKLENWKGWEGLGAWIRQVPYTKVWVEFIFAMRLGNEGTLFWEFIVGDTKVQILGFYFVIMGWYLSIYSRGE